MKDRASQESDDTGIGLIEIVIAMFLIAIMALALLPVFASTLQLSQKNIEIGRAAQIVNEQVNLAAQQAAATATCSAISTFAVAPNTPVPGIQNTDFRYTRTVSACPATYPATMTITISVTRAADGSHLAGAKTLVSVISN